MAEPCATAGHETMQPAPGDQGAPVPQGEGANHWRRGAARCNGVADAPGLSALENLAARGTCPVSLVKLPRHKERFEGVHVQTSETRKHPFSKRVSRGLFHPKANAT